MSDLKANTKEVVNLAGQCSWCVLVPCVAYCLANYFILAARPYSWSVYLTLIKGFSTVYSLFCAWSSKICAKDNKSVHFMMQENPMWHQFRIFSFISNWQRYRYNLCMLFLGIKKVYSRNQLLKTNTLFLSQRFLYILLH